MVAVAELALLSTIGSKSLVVFAACVLALQAAAALSVLAIGLAPGRRGRARERPPRRARRVEGWLTERRRGVCVPPRRASRPDGAVVEIGSFRGQARRSCWRSPRARSSRSTRTRAATAGRRRSRPRRRAATPTTRRSWPTCAAAGVADRVRHVRKFSADAHGDVAGPLSLLYVDGAHRFGPARADLAGWGGRVRPGGTMLVHDAFSSIGVTLALLVVCAGSRRWRYVGRTGSLAEYERRASSRGRLRDVARHLAELPWFARNVAIKVLVLAGRRRWAERIGLDPAAPWPY